MLPLVTAAVGVAILVGLAGIVVPLLPGSALILGSVLIWAFVAADPVGWWVAGVACAGFAAGLLLQYLVPQRRMRAFGVPGRTLVVGAIAGVVGMFVLPVLGLPLGFVAGVFVMETIRCGSAQNAWPSTVQALKAAAASYGIEIVAALVMTIAWIVGVRALLF